MLAEICQRLDFTNVDRSCSHNQVLNFFFYVNMSIKIMFENAIYIRITKNVFQWNWHNWLASVFKQIVQNKKKYQTCTHAK